MKELIKVSRWITIETLEVTKKHNLYYYAEPETEENEKRLVSAFRYKNHWYAMNQFLSRFGLLGFDHECNEYPAFIIGYDVENYFNPLLIEIDQYGEKVRLWKEV